MNELSNLKICYFWFSRFLRTEKLQGIIIISMLSSLVALFMGASWASYASVHSVGRITSVSETLGSIVVTKKGESFNIDEIGWIGERLRHISPVITPAFLVKAVIENKNVDIFNIAFLKAEKTQKVIIDGKETELPLKKISDSSYLSNCKSCDTITHVFISGTNEEVFLALLETAKLKGFSLLTRDQEQSTLTTLTHGFRVSIGLLLILIFFVSCTIAYGISIISFDHSKKILSFLRLLGAKQNLIFMLIFSEALFFGIISFLIGGLLFIPLIKSFVTIFLSALSYQYLDGVTPLITTPPLWIFGIGACVSFGVPLITNSSSFRSLSLLLPINALRETSAENKDTKGYISVIAIFLIFISLLVRHLSVDASIFSVILCVIGIFLLGGELTQRAQFLTKFIPSFFSLSTKELIQIMKKSFFISGGAISLSLTVLVSMSMFVKSYETAVSDWMNHTFKADIYIQDVTGVGISETFQKNLSLIENIKEISRATLYQEVVASLPLVVIATDLNINHMNGIYSFIEKTNNLNFSQHVLISESFARKSGLKVNDKLLILNNSMIVGGIYQDYTKDRGVVLIERSIVKPSTINSLLIYASLSNDASLEILLSKVKLLDETKKLDILTLSGLKTEVSKIFYQTFALTDLLKIILFLLVSLGTLSSFILSITHVKKTCKVFWMLGARASQIKRSYMYASFFILLPATIVGVIGGGILSYILITGLNTLLFGWTTPFIFDFFELLKVFLVASIVLIVLSRFSFNFKTISHAKLSEE